MWEELDLPSRCLEIRSVTAWGFHLASQSNQVNLLLDPDRITFGINVELCSETNRSDGGVGKNPQSKILSGRFG